MEDKLSIAIPETETVSDSEVILCAKEILSEFAAAFEELAK